MMEKFEKQFEDLDVRTSVSTDNTKAYRNVCLNSHRVILTMRQKQILDMCQLSQYEWE